MCFTVAQKVFFYRIFRLIFFVRRSRTININKFSPIINRLLFTVYTTVTAANSRRSGPDEQNAILIIKLCSDFSLDIVRVDGIASGAMYCSMKSRREKNPPSNRGPSTIFFLLSLPRFIRDPSLLPSCGCRRIRCPVLFFSLRSSAIFRRFFFRLGRALEIASND